MQLCDDFSGPKLHCIPHGVGVPRLRVIQEAIATQTPKWILQIGRDL